MTTTWDPQNWTIGIWWDKYVFALDIGPLGYMWNKKRSNT